MAMAQGAMQAQPLEQGQPQTAPRYQSWRTLLLGVLTIATALGLLVMLYFAFFYAGTDIEQGEVQRVFYIHVSSYAGGSVAFLLTVVGGALYLITRDRKWDRLAVSSVEIGLPFMTICLLTGAVWARPIWNTWWTADPRLNAMAVMWLAYAAYLTLRAAIDNPDRRARFAAVYGILAFVSVVYVFIIPRVRTDTLHPVVIGESPVSEAAKGAFELEADSRIGAAFGVAMTWWCLAALTFVWYRVRIENIAERVRVLRARILEKEA